MSKEDDERSDEIRRENHNGLLCRIGFEVLPLAEGAALGGLGRATGAEWLPAVPIGIDLMHNATGYTTLRGFWGLVKYAAGVALPYTDKIYYATQVLLDRI